MKREIGPPLREQAAEAVSNLVRQSLLGSVGVRASKRLHGWIKVLNQQPTAGTQRRDHLLQCSLALRHVDKHETCVDEVEGTCGRIVVGYIMSTNLDMVATDVLRPADVDVRSEHVTRRGHALGQPAGNGRPADTNLPAAPPLRDPQHLEVTEGHWVEERGKAVETVFGLGRMVVEQIAACADGEVRIVHHRRLFQVPRGAATGQESPLGCRTATIANAAQPAIWDTPFDCYGTRIKLFAAARERRRRRGRACHEIGPHPAQPRRGNIPAGRMGPLAREGFYRSRVMASRFSSTDARLRSVDVPWRGVSRRVHH